MENQFVVLVGTVVSGIDEIVGPFTTYKEAYRFALNHSDQVAMNAVNIIELHRDYSY